MGMVEREKYVCLVWLMGGREKQEEMPEYWTKANTFGEKQTTEHKWAEVDAVELSRNEFIAHGSTKDLRLPMSFV